MRKLLLLVAILFAGFSSYAQNNPSSNAKSTAGGSRWYNHSAIIDSITGGGMASYNLVPIWYDSAVSEITTEGMVPIRYISAAQALDPIYFTLWADTNYFDTGSIVITPTDDYEIDSISFYGVYVKNPNRPANVVDTLILSVSPVGSGTVTNPYYWANPVPHPWTYINGYSCATCQDSTVYGFTIDSNDVDIINRASNVAGRVLWKVPLVDSMRMDNFTGVSDAVQFTFPVMVNGMPGACNIPAGYGTGITITFKSGDVVISNTDTFHEYHNFRLLALEGLGDSMYMPYYYYGYDDRNMSNLMRYNNDSVYWPTLFLEGTTTINFAPEFLAIGIHSVCANCPLLNTFLSVKDVNAAVTTKTEAFPNPAANEVSIRFSISHSTDATVSITNAVGQVIAVQQVNAISGQDNTVKFSTADLAAGIYFYTVEARGQRTTNRFVVAH